MLFDKSQNFIADFKETYMKSLKSTNKTLQHRIRILMINLNKFFKFFCSQTEILLF